MKTKALIVLCALGGCASVQEEYAHMSTSGTYYDLCYSATDNRPGAINKKEAAARIVNERNVQCDWALFAQIHADEERRNLQMMSMGAAMMAANRPPAPRTYIVNGRMVTCTTTGRITNCM